MVQRMESSQGVEAQWQDAMLAELKHISSELNRTNSNLEGQQKWHSNRNQQIRVLITPTLFSLRDLDTVKQEFSAELWYEIFYKDPELRGIERREDVDWDRTWDPRIVLRNTTTVETMTRRNLIPVVGENVPIVHQFRKVWATFKANMDLTDLPFDHQKLTTQLMSGWSIKYVDLRKNYGSNDTINEDDFADSDQWTVSKYLECEHGTKTNLQSETFGKYPVYNITAHVQRKTAFYIWNTAFILFLIMLVSFTVFSVSIEDLDRRLTNTFTLLLTTVAFKLVVSQYLPTVPYLTLLDKYVLGWIIFQCVVAALNAVTSVIRDCGSHYSACLFDKVCVGVLGAGVISSHLGFGIFMRRKKKEKDGKLREMQEKFKRLRERIDNAYKVRKKKAPWPGSTTSTMMILTDEDLER
ncbi:PREDICTED: neuronal acetylcholine receptor subunit alpha-9-I-like [Branchiostoma belcheri]|uniref:Neuronal acetylcholine receptor subunit alpha-9-I-like n=1 Tax=Branchiostoma belcheri TaxID=7741 RepID=A0A6P4Z4B7_BRABE|nr:PREDICTED: neuronal acetylcholine receptor subunit alpha-9-I-like [Branchiostoma belcheri]